MGLLYCIYNNKKYKAKYKNGIIKITTTAKEQGFSNYIDVLGRKHDDLFMKELPLQDVDLVFYEEIELEYEGRYFPLFSSSIKSESVEEGRFMIFTDSEKVAQQYGFEKKEQFVFLKHISNDEIGRIRIIQKPIKEFDGSMCKNTIIEKNDIFEWLASLN